MRQKQQAGGASADDKTQRAAPRMEPNKTTKGGDEEIKNLREEIDALRKEKEKKRQMRKMISETRAKLVEEKDKESSVIEMKDTNDNVRYEIILMLQPTSPYRSKSILQKAINLLEISKFLSVTTFTILC